MTWSVSAKGTKREVKRAIVEQVGNSDNHESALAGLLSLVDDIKADRVEVSGNGWDQSATINIKAA